MRTGATVQRRGACDELQRKTASSLFWRGRVVFCVLVILFLSFAAATVATASDYIVKYYVFNMQTPQDLEKIKKFINSHPGVTKVESVLDRHWLYISMDDEILEDERFAIRVPLKKLGYPVERWDVMLEHPDGQD